MEVIEGVIIFSFFFNLRTKSGITKMAECKLVKSKMTESKIFACRNTVAKYPFQFYCCKLKRNRVELVKKSKFIGHLNDLNANMWIISKKYINENNLRQMIIKEPIKIKEGVPLDIFFLTKPFIKKVLYKEKSSA